jgi:hypothetical protein
MTNFSVGPANQLIYEIEPYVNGKRAAGVQGITVERAALTLAHRIMFSHPSLSAHQLEFGVHHFESFCLRNSSCVATLRPRMPSQGMPAEHMRYS